MWSGYDTTTSGFLSRGQWPYDSTQTYVPEVFWVRSSDLLSKKPFSLSEFIAKKARITEAWHEAFKWELLKWRRCGQTEMALNHFLYRRTVEYVVRTWLSVDWRWVFKRWVQELYET